MRRYLFRPEVLVLLLAISLFGAKQLWEEVSSSQIGDAGHVEVSSSQIGDAGPVEVSSSYIVGTSRVESFIRTGDTGPGGGIVFYVAATPFACGPTLASTCTYLEAAPSGWSVTLASGCQRRGTSIIDPLCPWSGNSIDFSETDTVSGTDTAIGTGYANTVAIIGGSTSGIAANASQAYRGGGKTDWYLPSRDELNELCKYAF